MRRDRHNKGESLGEDKFSQNICRLSREVLDTPRGERRSFGKGAFRHGSR